MYVANLPIVTTLWSELNTAYFAREYLRNRNASQRIFMYLRLFIIGKNHSSCHTQSICKNTKYPDTDSAMGKK